MKHVVLLVNNFFASFILFACVLNHVDSVIVCNNDWIRLMYMFSCGVKKRENSKIRNESLSDPLPREFYATLRYYQERDPENPLFNEKSHLLKELLREKEIESQRNIIYARFGRSSLALPLSNTNNQYQLRFPQQEFQDEIDNEMYPELYIHGERNFLNTAAKCCSAIAPESCTGEDFADSC